LDAIRGHIENSTSPTKDLYLAHVAKEIKDVNGKDYDVCVWLLCDDKKPLPSKGKLPLIAKYELKLMHDHLLQVCKFKRIVLRFIPVEMAGFVRSKVAKAQVA
jgi:hypothetical protein